MPLFIYTCEHGHKTEELRKEAARNDPTLCGQCGRLAQREGLELQKRPRVVSGTPKFGKPWVKR